MGSQSNRQRVATRLQEVTAEWNALIVEAHDANMNPILRMWHNWPSNGLPQLHVGLHYEEKYSTR